MEVSNTTIGYQLTKILEKIQTTSNDYQNQGIYSKIEHIWQLRQTVENALVAYNDILGVEATQVGVSAKLILEELKVLAKNVTATDLSIWAQVFFNQLPFNEKHPRLTTVMPRFVLRSGDRPICFKFYGNFKYCDESSTQLTFQGKIYTPAKSSDYQLEFSLTPSCIFPLNKVPNAEQLIFGEGELKLTSTITAVYKVTIGAFASPKDRYSPDPTILSWREIPLNFTQSPDFKIIQSGSGFLLKTVKLSELRNI